MEINDSSVGWTGSSYTMTVMVQYLFPLPFMIASNTLGFRFSVPISFLISGKNSRRTQRTASARSHRDKPR